MKDDQDGRIYMVSTYIFRELGLLNVLTFNKFRFSQIFFAEGFQCFANERLDSFNACLIINLFLERCFCILILTQN